MDENTRISDLTVAEFRKVMRQCLVTREDEILADRIRAGLSNGYEADRIQYAKAQEHPSQCPLKGA
jgi:hypothetical protein